MFDELTEQEVAAAEAASEEVTPSEQEAIEKAIVLMEGSSNDDTGDTDGDSGDSDGAADKSGDTDTGDGGDSSAGSPDESGEEDESSSQAAGKPAKSEKLASQYARLMKKDNELRKQKKVMDEREAKLTKLVDLADKINEDPYSAAEGLFGPRFFQDWTMKKLGEKKDEAPESPKEKALRERVEQLEGSKQEEKAAAAQQTEDEGIKAYEVDVQKAIEAGGDEFELMKAYPDAYKEARAFAELYAEQFGQVLAPETAIGEMEKFFRGQLETGLVTKAGIELITKLGYVKSEVSTDDSDDIAEETKTKGKQASTVKNDLAASSGGVKPNKVDSIDEDDMIADGLAELNRQEALANRTQ